MNTDHTSTPAAPPVSPRMSSAAFKRLKVGDNVTLAEPRQAYGCGFPAEFGEAYLPVGTVGTVGAVNVPNTTGKLNPFACIDFPPETQIQDRKGRPITWENLHRNPFRVAARAPELCR